MQPKAVANGTAALCRSCEAVWLDKEAASSVAVKAEPPTEQPTLSSETLRCPQCGAPLANSWDETCQYCGAAIHAPTQVVMVPMDNPDDGQRERERARDGSRVVADIFSTLLRPRRN
jgi:hypothetical protein